jgi:type I restriction enzyme S subunit
MSEWEEKTLGDLITLKRGYDLPERLREEGAVPIYSSSGISGFHSTSKVDPPGVVTGRYGSIGSVFLCTEPYWPLNTTLYVQDFKGSDEVFIYYFLQKVNWHQFNDKSAVPGVNRNDLHAELVFVPSLTEQKQIAAVLSALDRKIENLRQQNETLEQIAQTLFKHWFVDFEFPNEDGKPYRSSGGAMQPSELGEIPVGWRVERLENIVDTINGYSYKSADLGNSTTALVNLKNFNRNGGFRLDGFKEIIGNSYQNKHIIKPNDLLVAHTDLTQNADILGNPILLQPLLKYSCYVLSMDLVKIVSKYDKIDNFYLYYLLSTIFFKKHCIGYANGTTVLHLSKKAIPEYQFPLPGNHSIIEDFQCIASINRKSISNNIKQIQILTQTRDTLLPKLMSGKLRVKN